MTRFTTRFSRLSLATLSAAALTGLAAPALAHPGHVAEHAGHTHWLALIAAGIAVAIVAGGFVWRSLRRRRLAHG